MAIKRKKDFGECKMVSIQFNGKTVGISFPSSFLRSKRRIPTERTNRGPIRFQKNTDFNSPLLKIKFVKMQCKS